MNKNKVIAAIIMLVIFSMAAAGCIAYASVSTQNETEAVTSVQQDTQYDDKTETLKETEISLAEDEKTAEENNKWLETVKKEIQQDEVKKAGISLLEGKNTIKSFSYTGAYSGAEELYNVFERAEMQLVDITDDFFEGTLLMLEGTGWKIIAKEGCDYVRIENSASGKYVGIADSLYPDMKIFDWFRDWFYSEECNEAKSITITDSYTDPEAAVKAWMSEYESRLLNLSDINYNANNWVSVRLYKFEEVSEQEKGENEAEVFNIVYYVYRVPVNEKYAEIGGEHRYQGTDESIPENAWVYAHSETFVHGTDGSWYVRN